MMETVGRLIKFLGLIEEVEGLAAELYLAYQKRFMEEDEESAYFFYRMSVEEKGHAALAKYVKKLVKNDPKAFAEVKGQDIEVDGLPDVKAWLIDRINSAPGITLEEALAFATELETSVGEGYGIIKLSGFVSHAPKIERLLKSLTEDKDHAEAVTVFAKSKGVVF